MSAIGVGGDVGFDGLTVLSPLAPPLAAAERPRTTAAPRVQPSLERRHLWEHRYATRLRLTDAAIVLAVAGTTAVVDALATGHGLFELLRTTTVAATIWLVMLWLARTRLPSITGSGVAEYKRVAHATGFAFGVMALLFIVFQWSEYRLQLLLALPVGLVAIVLDRWLWRKWLMKQRAFGHYASRAIVAGSRSDIEYVIRTLTASGSLHYIVIGAAPLDESSAPVLVDGRAYPSLGSMRLVAEQARAHVADTIIVTGQPEGDPDYVKRLSWELEGTAADLVLSSRVVDVAGPRISFRQVEGLPLIHVKIPEFEGGNHVIKRLMDIIVATLALIPIGLITPIIALAIKLDSPGPVFFRQTRIGRDGREFSILKFRTMCVDAEARLAALKAQNEGSGLLFKMKCDPRITRVGAVLRRFSLDELPQFANVLRGDMSVVGPRPPLPSEVVAYDGTVGRRLYIKPGITGLWQVSGRSDLSWEESVRLDLRYVENWSITGDLVIMWRTAMVMVAPKGAY